MSRLITDTAYRLHCSEKTVFWKAAQLEGNYDCDGRYRWMWAAYIGGSMPKLVEDFCLDVLTGRKPHLHQPQSEASIPPTPFSRIPIS